MSSTMFKPATREKLKLRMAIDGPAGSGKTYTALRAAFTLGRRVAVIDSEHRSASKYAGLSPDGVPWKFDVCELTHFAPTTYTQVVKEAAAAGYDVVVIDSLSHAWDGVGGALDQVDKKASGGGNSFTAWKDVTPQHRELIETILAANLHVIGTMRTKTEWVLEEGTNAKGKSVMVPKRVGMAAVQRQGMEYEFDLVVDMDIEHLAKVTKSRCPLMDGKTAVQPGAAFFAPVVRWLDEGADPVPRAPAFVPAADVPASDIQSPVVDPTAPPHPLPHQDGDKARIAVDGPCTPEQVQDILRLAEKLGMGVDDLRAVIAKRNCQYIAELTVRQAIEIAQRLSVAAGEDVVPF